MGPGATAGNAVRPTPLMRAFVGASVGAFVVTFGCAAMRDVEPQVARIGDYVRVQAKELPRPIVGWLLVSTEDRVVVRDTDGRERALARPLVEKVYVDLKRGPRNSVPIDCPPVRRRSRVPEPQVSRCSTEPHWFPARLPTEAP